VATVAGELIGSATVAGGLMVGGYSTVTSQLIFSELGCGYFSFSF
jgi:hypothetical protein